MAKTSPNSIQSLNEDWGNDVNVNLPFSGEAVQTFIKSYLRNVTAAAWFDATSYTMYFFANETDRDSFINDPTQSSLPTFACPMNFSSTLYHINVVNNTGATQINTSTNAGTLTLSATFTVQTKSISDTEWTDTQTGCYVTILIDRGLTGNYTPVTERALYAAGSTISYDIFNDLGIGLNRVKFLFEAEDDSVTQALVYTVNLAELYVELFNNTWYQPVLEDDDTTWRLGGFKIAGAGSKTLHISFYDSEGNVVIDDLDGGIFIGTTNAYTTMPYYYPITVGNDILALETGVYKVRLYVSTSSLTSEVIEYNMMFVASEDTSTAKLVCINDVAEAAYNYSSSNLCNYAVYDGLGSSADIVVTFQEKNGDTVVKTVTRALEVPTSIMQTLGYEVLWSGIEGTGYFIDFEIDLDTASAGAEIPIDNSTVFPPTPGYDFYMLATNRNNGEANRDKFVNVADNSELAATWTDVDFIDGVDGWTTDDEGRYCLRIPAKTRVILPYSAFNLLSGDNCTFEICYRAVNVSDYDENIITLSPNPTAAGFSGIRIKPNNVTVHSGTDTTAENDTQRGVNISDDDRTHFVLTVNPYYEGTNKLVKGFVNGCKNFLFDYSASTEWAGFNGNLTIGSDRTDVYVYFIRHYPVALSDAAVMTNYINSLTTVEERTQTDAKLYSVLDLGATNVDFEAVRDNGYNYFIVHMANDAGVPSAANGWGKKTASTSVLEMHFGDHPEWDWRIGSDDIGVETMGQGTTSMNYYRWNIRWRIDKSNSDPADPNDKKKVPIQYVTGRTRVGSSYQYSWSEPTLGKTLKFDGTSHPQLMRITAKINQASSMQSHKIGATRAYTALHDAIGLRNEAQTLADNNNTPRPVVSVYEYPAFGFEYNARYNTYTFVGLFTIGPDKGDKPTFGFDAVKNTLISLEGTDHSQPLAKFAYPWTADVNYYYNEEGISIDLGEGSYLTGLEIGNCHNKEIDKENKGNKAAEDQPLIRAILATEFEPAYLLAWENSTLIFPITTSHPYYDRDVQHTLENINSHLQGETYEENFRLGQYNDRLSYADLQFWIEGDQTYTLYYFDERAGIYKPDISLATQNGTPTGSTANDKNDWFKAQRRARFMASAADYWDLDDTIYHYVFCLMFGATDNFAKNSYPYKMATVENGGRWKWRQDDLDTIFDIDNSGRDSKPYQIEFEDANGNTSYFAGSNSVFWNLIHECYWDDYDNGAGRGIRTIGRLVANAMMSLSGTTNPYAGFVSFIGNCFWNNAQNYFPASAYNVDSVFKYETAWLVNGQNVPPLSQALGNHYSGERLWVMRRAVYMLSLFRAGAFGDYTDTSLGTISFRPNSLTVNLVPLMWMYPALAVGQNTVVSGGRTEPGHSCTLSRSSDGNTAFYIQASNWLASLGDLKAVTLGQQDIGNITITAAKLISFVIGSAIDGEVTTNIPGVIFANTKCLESIDARNAASIRTMNGIDICARLRTLLLSGTNVTNIDIQIGSKLETLSLPATIQRIVLRNLSHLSSLVVDAYTNVSTLFIDNCTIDTLAVIAAAYNGSTVLEYIRVIWSGIEQVTASAVTALAGLVDPQYKGIAADGSTIIDKPFIEGELQVTESIVTGDLDKLDIVSEEPYQTTLIKALVGSFDTNLYVIYDPSTVIVTFLDSEVARLCIANWDTNSSGQLDLSEAKAVTTLNTVFRGNTLIETFNELKYFTGLTSLYGSSVASGGAFAGCTALEEITLPKTVTSIGQRAFMNCHALTVVHNTKQVTTISDEAFYLSESLESFEFNNTITRIGTSAFRSSTSASPSTPNGSLILDSLPQSLTTIGNYAFTGNDLDGLDINLPNLTSLGTGAFQTTNIVKVSNLGSITRVEGASGVGLFRYCKKLKEVHLPLTVTTITQNAFYGDILLDTISGLDNVTSIGSDIFNGTALESLSFNKLVTIHDSGFQSMPVLKTVYAPLCTKVNAYAFRNDHLLETFTSSPITNLGIQSFRGCEKLTTINLSNTITGIPEYCFYNDENGTANSTIKGSLTLSSLPTSITTIGTRAFRSNPLCDEVYLPNLTSLDSGAFQTTGIKRITSLGSITAIPGGTNIGCFQQCRSLVSVVIPSTVTELGLGTFNSCVSLESVEVPAAVTNMGNYTFYNCTSLQYVIMRPTTPPTIGKIGVFGGTSHPIYVPYSSDHSILNAYKAATNWSGYASRIFELDENGNIPT